MEAREEDRHVAEEQKVEEEEEGGKEIQIEIDVDADVSIDKDIETATETETETETGIEIEIEMSLVHNFLLQVDHRPQYSQMTHLYELYVEGNTPNNKKNRKNSDKGKNGRMNLGPYRRKLNREGVIRYNHNNNNNNNFRIHTRSPKSENPLAI